MVPVDSEDGAIRACQTMRIAEDEGLAGFPRLLPMGASDQPDPPPRQDLPLNM